MNDQASTPPTGASPAATILIVDDVALNLRVLGELLKPYYRVLVANSGELALRTAQGACRPDLILLDIMMPDIDGFEVLRRLQDNPATRDIPVIFVTAVHDEESEQQGFELGAADYIHKPIRAPIVLARVRAQLQARAAREMLKKNNLRLAGKVEEGVSALEHAQMLLLQSEKMAAMGQLAAGVAHEINNPIGFVSSNLVTLTQYVEDLVAIIDTYEQVEAAGSADAFAAVRRVRQELDYDYLKQDIVALLAESRDGVGRVRKIVLDLKDFSRAGEAEWQWADLHQGIDSTLNIVWHELKYNCTVNKRYGPLPQVYCLPSQLNQVFMNLLVNAGQAIEGQGEITITTEAHGSDAVRITIADTGSGIAPKDIERIFDPFFTTKPVGKGTGLGLSLVWSIVGRHGGSIKVESTLGQGTAFVLTLPVRAIPPATGDEAADR